MLVARRDPISDDGAQHRPQPQARLTRAVGLLQMTGTLLGIPVALVSAYSVYHSNFSTEAVCQSLRTNIVSVLDKSADASTVRALVRRDVAAFQQNCGAVDPDAVAAFKSLLTAKAATPPAAKAAPPPVKNAASEPVHRPEPVKQPAAKPAVAESEPARHGAEVSDANWLAAVRGALVTHDPVPPRAEPTPPAHTASKNCAANSGNIVQMLPPATTLAPPRLKKYASCRMRSKSGCRPVRKTRSYFSA